MKARIVKQNDVFNVQILKGFIFRKWSNIETGFTTLENAEKWIKTNLFPIEFEVVAEYVDNTKKIHV
ncbi:MAG: hypothetical protein KDH96_03510 [Candidatus Riesia sp.]|nr:hypothetical protein [Candidatus Riesia sp.]